MPLSGHYIGHGESPIILPSSSSEETSVDKWRSVPWLMHNLILSHSPPAPSHTVLSHSEDDAPIDVPRCVGYVSTWMRGSRLYSAGLSRLASITMLPAHHSGLQSEYLAPAPNRVENACVVDRHVLLCDDLDYLLGHHPPGSSRDVVELAAPSTVHLSRRVAD